MTEQIITRRLEARAKGELYGSDKKSGGSADDWQTAAAACDILKIPAKSALSRALCQKMNDALSDLEVKGWGSLGVHGRAAALVENKAFYRRGETVLGAVSLMARYRPEEIQKRA